MLILEDMYVGDIRPNECSFKRNSQYARALDEVVKAGDALADGLSEEQKALFENHMSAQREVSCLTGLESNLEAVWLIIRFFSTLYKIAGCMVSCSPRPAKERIKGVRRKKSLRSRIKKELFS